MPVTCFWLLIPILVFNVIFSRFLPSFFQPEIWDQFPRCLRNLENSFRLSVMLCTLFLPFAFPDTNLKVLGWMIFIIGVSTYFCSWFCLIRYPSSNHVLLFSQTRMILPFSTVCIYSRVPLLKDALSRMERRRHFRNSRDSGSCHRSTGEGFLRKV